MARWPEPTDRSESTPSFSPSEHLTRQGLVPVTFADQVDAGLRLLIRHAAEEQTRQAARLVAADRQRAEQAYRQIHRRGR